MLKIEGRRVQLRHIAESDLPVLHSWRNSREFLDVCSTRRNVVTLGEFQKEIKRDFETDRYLQCMILSAHGPVGTIFAYDANPTDGFVFVTTFISTDHQGAGYGAEAFVLFVHYLFNSLPGLFKVYADVYSHNQHSLSCLIGAGFVKEGVFKAHRLHGGLRHDLIRLAFFREQLDTHKRLLARIRTTQP